MVNSVKLRDFDDSGDLSLENRDLLGVGEDGFAEGRVWLEVILFVTRTWCGYPPALDYCSVAYSVVQPST